MNRGGGLVAINERGFHADTVLFRGKTVFPQAPAGKLSISV